jgi:hydroxypyruvate reductase
MPNPLACLQQALVSCRGDHLVASFFDAPEWSGWFEQPWYGIAVGKASVAMMEGALALGHATLTSGLLIRKQGSDALLADSRLQQMSAAHPIPDESSLLAGQELIDFVQRLPEQARVLFMLSGGTSSLVEVLPEDWTLARWQAQTQTWLASGWDIQRINRARQSLSLIKGGKLLKAFAVNADVLQLIMTDVPDQDVKLVGSGLLFGDISDSRVNSYSLADNRRLLNLLAECLPIAQVMPDYVCTEVNELAVWIASQASEGQTKVWGGEPVVVLPEQAPAGGRMQHLALSVAWQLRSVSFSWSFIALASDGDDGTTCEAGAMVNQQTLAMAEQQGWSMESALAEFNAHALLADVGALLQTGYTGTNVNDVMILSCGDTA